MARNIQRSPKKTRTPAPKERPILQQIWHHVVTARLLLDRFDRDELEWGSDKGQIFDSDRLNIPSVVLPRQRIIEIKGKQYLDGTPQSGMKEVIEFLQNLIDEGMKKVVMGYWEAKGIDKLTREYEQQIFNELNRYESKWQWFARLCEGNPYIQNPLNSLGLDYLNESDAVEKYTAAYVYHKTRRTWNDIWLLVQSRLTREMFRKYKWIRIHDRDSPDLREIPLLVNDLKKMFADKNPYSLKELQTKLENLAISSDGLEDALQFMGEKGKIEKTQRVNDETNKREYVYHLRIRKDTPYESPYATRPNKTTLSSIRNHSK